MYKPHLQTRDIGHAVLVGDYVRDPMDGEIRTISGFEIYDEVEAAVLFEDGGIMGLNELTTDDISLDDMVFGGEL